MQIHAIIHAPFEKLGVIETWALKHKYQLSTSHTYQGDILPKINEFDFLIIMGGPQSPLEVSQYPYLQDEINLAKATIAAQKPMLGICLGAQIIAEALGAKTERSPYKEIGVYPVQLTAAGQQDPLFKQFSMEFDVMHWHNDMPGIPSGAEILAQSAGCPRQAFRYGDRIYGLQFHLEMTNELVNGMIEHCANDLIPNKFVKSAEELRAENMHDINQKIYVLLGHLVSFIENKVNTTCIF